MAVRGDGVEPRPLRRGAYSSTRTAEYPHADPGSPRRARTSSARVSMGHGGIAIHLHQTGIRALDAAPPRGCDHAERFRGRRVRPRRRRRSAPRVARRQSLPKLRRTEPHLARGSRRGDGFRRNTLARRLQPRTGCGRCGRSRPRRLDRRSDRRDRPRRGLQHAITIDSTPEEVWPWLVQMGQGRAGFYSHDHLERLTGAGITNADEIHPEWQTLAVGDLMRTYRPLPRFEPLGWFVAALEPGRALVVHEPRRKGVINSSWAFVLEPFGDGARGSCRAGASAAAASRTRCSSGSSSIRPTSSWKPASSAA